MKTLLVLNLLLLSLVSFPQQNLTFPIEDHVSMFRWESIEAKSSGTIIDKFIRDNPQAFRAYRSRDKEIAYLNLDSLRKDLHLIDLNADKLNDIVFDGQSEGEPRLIEIYLNAGSSFKKVFSAFQGIRKIEWLDGRIKKLYIDNWGCCADYLEFHLIYDISFSKTNVPVFTQIYQGVSIDDTVQPDSIFKNPIRFEIMNEGYKIRSSPNIDDSSDRPWDNNQSNKKGSGNSIGKLEKGAKGTAIAKKVDGTDREWFLVEIDEEYLPVNDIIYIENEFPTKLIGWISSRFIRIK